MAKQKSKIVRNLLTKKKDIQGIHAAAYVSRFLFLEQRFHEKRMKLPTVTRTVTKAEKQPVSPKQSAKYAERHTEKWIRIIIPET